LVVSARSATIFHFPVARLEGGRIRGIQAAATTRIFGMEPTRVGSRHDSSISTLPSNLENSEPEFGISRLAILCDGAILGRPSSSPRTRELVPRRHRPTPHEGGNENDMTIGSLEWATATSGNLSNAERLRFLVPILRTTAAYTTGRLRMLLGLRPARVGTLDLERLVLPDTKLVADAMAACRETLTPPMQNHSLRTFAFGLALANLDRVHLDIESFYVASLLHDIALETPTPKRCFAVVGAERALAIAKGAGADDAQAHAIAEGISMHVTPGVGFEIGPIGPMLSAGALLDLAGVRLWDLDSGFAQAAEERHPRLAMKRHLTACWSAEARAVPGGRAAFIARWAAFGLFVRLAPYRE
jgi:hypothetical protein